MDDPLFCWPFRPLHIGKIFWECICTTSHSYEYTRYGEFMVKFLAVQ